MRIEPLLTESSCLVLLDRSDVQGVMGALALTAANVLERPDHMDILDGLLNRERTMRTTTPEGVAFPHTTLPSLARTALIIAALRPPVRFHHGDPTPMCLAVCMVDSAERPFEHVRLLARLARIFRSPAARRTFAAALDAAELRSAIIREDRAHE